MRNAADDPVDVLLDRDHHVAEHRGTARAGRRVASALRQIESNDDERMTSIAKLALKRGSYGYALFED